MSCTDRRRDNHEETGVVTTNWCRDFEARCPSCCQPVLKTSILFSIINRLVREGTLRLLSNIHCCRTETQTATVTATATATSTMPKLSVHKQTSGSIKNIHLSYFHNLKFVFSVLIRSSSVFCILALGSGQRLLYRLGLLLVLVLWFCANSDGGVYS